MGEEIFLEAKGSTGQVELLKDRVRIRRKGLPAKGRGGDHEIPYSQLASIELESGWSGGYIYFVVAGQEDEAGRKDKYQVNFGSSQRAQFEEIKRVIEQRIDDGVLQEAELQVQEGTSAEHRWTLKDRFRRLVEGYIDPDEPIHYLLQGGGSQAILGLEDRLLVVKSGWQAGAMFGGRVTSFYYADITGIEAHFGFHFGVLEVNSSSVRGSDVMEFWNFSGKPEKDIFKVPNCIPISKKLLRKQADQLEGIRAKISQAKQVQSTPTSSTVAPTDSISTELQRLASLRDSGILTDEEFQQAKKKLLS